MEDIEPTGAVDEGTIKPARTQAAAITI